MRDLKPRVPEGPKPTDAQEEAQGALEASEERDAGGEEAGVRLPRAYVPTPRPVPRARGSSGYQEAF